MVIAIIAFDDASLLRRRRGASRSRGIAHLVVALCLLIGVMTVLSFVRQASAPSSTIPHSLQPQSARSLTPTERLFRECSAGGYAAQYCRAGYIPTPYRQNWKGWTMTMNQKHHQLASPTPSDTPGSKHSAIRKACAFKTP